MLDFEVKCISKYICQSTFQMKSSGVKVHSHFHVTVMSRNIILIVEHLEDGIGQWTKLEYLHILQIAEALWRETITKQKNLVGRQSEQAINLEIVFSNMSEKESNELGQIFTTPLGVGCSIFSITISSLTCAEYAIRKCKAFSEEYSACGIPLVCVLDPQSSHRLTEEIFPTDDKHAETSSLLVLSVGGILGAHPMDGRTYRELTSTFGEALHSSVQREYFKLCTAHLGHKQMTTDTAAIVALKVILQEAKLEGLEYVDDPKFRLSKIESIKMNGFRYLCDSNRKDLTRRTALLPKGMLDYWKSEDFTLN